MTLQTPTAVPCWSPVPAQRLADSDEHDVACCLAAEMPIAITYGGLPYAVLMATPNQLDDLARGFSITDGVCSRAEIDFVAVLPPQDGPDGTMTGITVDVRLAAAAFERFLRDRSGRHRRSYTSCGICGIATLDDLPRAARARSPATVFDRGAVRAALRALPDHQPLNRLTGALHAAAWIRLDGAVALVREDVGRHNALDKLIGALNPPTEPPPEPGFCVITSRCSHEMVQKAAAAGFEMLVAISAPTSLAITEARRLGLTLVALARADSQTIYTGAHRIAGRTKMQEAEAAWSR